jgi:Tfp pilus assembly protein PilX
MVYHNVKNQGGFALLMSLVVVTVVISVGVSVLDLSTKQIRLSTNAKDSEVAFHAANAGMECARYIRRTRASDMELGNAISPTCFGVSASPNTQTEITSGVSGNGKVFKYDYSFSWSSDTRCSQITTLIASSTPLGTGLLISTSSMANLIPGYPSVAKTCAAGERCAVISSRGYNKPCNAISNYGTVEREVLLQF